MTKITELVQTAMGSIKEMVDVNTIVGEPVETTDGTVIIPISRVSFGFGAGGTEFSAKVKTVDGQDSNFGGGTGGGVSINPMGFLVVCGGNVQFLPVSSGAPEKLADYIPVAIDKVTAFIKKKKEEKGE
ncbi:MAG: GerW family sporulation protein [Clostridia bacterium]|nr:GerW family sporulation protein [Clostridia bacterium]